MNVHLLKPVLTENAKIHAHLKNVVSTPNVAYEITNQNVRAYQGT